MYTLKLSKQADKFLRKLSQPLSQRIKTKLLELARDPYSNQLDIVKLKKPDGYRLRVGEWRVIYDLQENEESVILVLKIALRGGAYQ